MKEEDHEVLGKLEDLFGQLMELATKREEHFQIFDRLMRESEERIGKTNSMVQALIGVIADTKNGSEKRITELNALVEKTLSDKTACINRYEKKLEKAESRADTLQRQNDQLIAQMNWLDGQIAKLEDHALGTKSYPQMPSPLAEINLGNFKGKTGGVKD